MRKLITTLSAIVTLAASLAFGGVAAAQGKYKNVELLIKNNDGRYQKDEKVEVWAYMHEDDGESLLLTVTENGNKVVESEPLPLKPGKKTKILTKSYADPTDVMVSVSPGSNPKIFSAVGFIVAPEEFRPGFEEPADFVEFWQNQARILRDSEMEATLTPVEIPEDQKKYRAKVEAYDLEISMPEGNPVHAYISWPKDAEPGSCGILICPHGSGVRTSGLNNAIWRANGHHAIVIDINAHGIPNGRADEYYKELGKGELKDYRTRKCTGHEDFYFRLMYLRMLRVLDYACTLKQWDGEKVALIGTSQGGGQCAALGGIDPRVKFMALEVPALADLGGKLAGHHGGWPYFGRFKESRDGDYMNVFPYYDAANFLKHYYGILYVEAGLLDTTTAPECVYSAFNVAVSENKVISTNPYREHGSKSLWEDNYKVWRETADRERKDALNAYLKAKK